MDSPAMTKRIMREHAPRRRRIGVVHRLILAAIATAGASPPVAAAPPEAPPSSAPVDPGVEVLAIEKERNSRFTLPVLVDGAGPFAFMIDTGSQATVVTHDVRAEAGLDAVGRVMLIGMASRREVELVRVGRMNFGGRAFTDFDAPVLAREHVGADGIIGVDSLQNLRVVLDFRNQTITLQDATRRDSRGGFEIIVRARQKRGQLLITDALVEGVRATVIIDTGAQASLGNLALRERIRARRASEIVTSDVNGVDIAGQLAVVRSLAFGGMALNEVPLTFADAPAFAALGLKDQPVLSVGMQHLALFDRVAIDFSRGRILFDVPSDVARAMRDARRGNIYSTRF